MTSPYQTLGIPETATADEAKKAFRKLAMKHHPDLGGDPAVFMKYKEAIDRIESGWTPPPKPTTSSFSPGYKPQKKRQPNVFDEFKAATSSYSARGGTFNRANSMSRDIVARATLREAFLGFNVVVPSTVVKNSSTLVAIPGGLPDNHVGEYHGMDGTLVSIMLQIDTGKFRLRQVGEAKSILEVGMNPGDLETEVDVDAIDCITGGWITVKDFLEEEFKVRIPEGFDPAYRLKMGGRGYTSQIDGKPSLFRGDMLVKLNVKFNAPANMEKQKILNLYNAIQDVN